MHDTERWNNRINLDCEASNIVHSQDVTKIMEHCDWKFIHYSLLFLGVIEYCIFNTKYNTNKDVHMHANGLEIKAGADKNECMSGLLSLVCVFWHIGWMKAVAHKITKKKAFHNTKSIFP